uniref:Uncharacterized protein n=1 Tax=Rhizophora mucronata TaxID=61149 RepID=A0A2P2NBF3_RHIMU
MSLVSQVHGFCGNWSEIFLYGYGKLILYASDKCRIVDIGCEAPTTEVVSYVKSLTLLVGNSDFVITE